MTDDAAFLSALTAELRTEEGFRAKPYRDQFGYLTIGGEGGQERGIVGHGSPRTTGQPAADCSRAMSAFRLEICSWWKSLRT